MECLYCGHCCKHYSPLSEGECPHLVQMGTIYLCSVYDHYLQRCRDHKYPSRICLVGLEHVFPDGPSYSWQVAKRIDEGWEAGKTLQTKT